MWIVRAEFDHGRGEVEHVSFGPFTSEVDASNWMDSYPDDEDMVEMNCEYLNSPTLPSGEPNH